MHPAVWRSGVALEGRPSLPAIFEVVGQVAVGLVGINRNRLTPNDRAFDFLTTVAAIHITDTPLIDARSGIRPAHVDVKGILQVASQQNGVVKRTDIEFQWFAGFAVSQKQKSIKALHDAIRQK